MTATSTGATVPAGSTDTRVVPSAPADTAATGTTSTSPSLDAAVTVTRRFTPVNESGNASTGSITAARPS